MLRTLILHINISQKLQTHVRKKNCSIKEPVTILFFQPKLICQYVWIHMNYFNFFLIFENHIYRKMFESHLQIVLIDYSETSWVWCIIFLWKHIEILWGLIFFSKRKQKILRMRKNLKKIGKIDKSIMDKKKLGYRFFCWIIFFSNFLITF